MGWGDLRNKLVEEVKANNGKAISILTKNPNNLKTHQDDIIKRDEEKKKKIIEFQKSQVYRKEDKFYDLFNDDITVAYDFLKELMWRKGFTFKDEGMGYIQFYEFAKEMSLEYRNCENEEKQDLIRASVIEQESFNTDEFTTPSDDYNLITKTYQYI